MPISQSVGVNGANISRDVQYVQALLNVDLEDRGRTQLTLDGVVGTATINAISQFQFAVLGFADGIVEPGLKTIVALEANIGSIIDEVTASTHLATILSYEPIPDEPTPSEEPPMDDSELEYLLTIMVDEDTAASN